MSRRASVVLLAMALAWPSMLTAQSIGFVERDTAVVTGKIRLPATLSIPTNAVRAAGIVLVHGSGPNDRDETVGANISAGVLREGSPHECRSPFGRCTNGLTE